MSTARYIVIFPTVDGRRSHQLTDEPLRVLGMRVAEQLLTAKQVLASCEIYEIQPIAINKSDVDRHVEFQRLVVTAKQTPHTIREMILAKKLDENRLEQLRRELQRADPHLYHAPWPFNEAEPEEDPV